MAAYVVTIISLKISVPIPIYQQAATIFLLIALVALVGYGATEGVPDVIRARSFEVVDKDGGVAQVMWAPLVSTKTA